MYSQLILFHGSPCVVEKPELAKGKLYNDYGQGFYCTESLELAKEWACSGSDDGFANKYSLNTDGLSILSLSGGDFHVLNWLAVLITNRTFRLSNDLAVEAKEYLTHVFLPDISKYDIICGYRADDSYFAFASAFLIGALSLRQLDKAMSLGELGEQVVLKSQRSFDRIRFLEAEKAEAYIYFAKRGLRDENARTAYRTERSRSRASDDVYMVDILRGQWKNDDIRLRANIS